MKVTIDSRPIECGEKKTILEVARENGIYIPSLCDHPRLVPFSGCRLCLVEVKGRRGYVPACSTLVEDGQEIVTESPELLKLRTHVLELVLSEHPSACLICSEKENCSEHKATIRKVGEVTGCILCSNNGRCGLQDVVQALKIEKVNFPALYRDFEVKKNDPFFNRDYNLCILCGRCVRICHEVRGASALAFIFRGNKAVVGTVFDRTLRETGCQFCGACVDVCPTGALVERAVRYDGIPDKKSGSVCALCSLGCELELNIKDGKILCALPAEGGAVNRGQACVKGRFLVRDIVHHPKRILRPLVRKSRGLEEVSWEEALNLVARKMSGYEGKEIGIVAAAEGTCEDSYIFHKFAREGLKTENFSISAEFSPLAGLWNFLHERGVVPGLNWRIEDIRNARVLFTMGGDLPAAHPIVWLEVLKAVRNGAKLLAAGPIEPSYGRCVSQWLQIQPGSESPLLGFLSKILLESEEARTFSHEEGFEEYRKTLEDLKISDSLGVCGIPEEELRKFALRLAKNKPAVILFDPLFSEVAWGSRNLSALWNLAGLIQAQVIPLGLENNVRGAFEIIRSFGTHGKSLSEMARTARGGGLKALYAAGPFSGLKDARPEFVVIQDCFLSEYAEFADVLLPAATFTETDGFFINLEGKVQKLEKAVEPRGEARPDWWIVSQVAQKMGLSGFSFKSAGDIMEEIGKFIPAFNGITSNNFKKEKDMFLHEEKKESHMFVPCDFTHPPVHASPEFPFLLVAGKGSDIYRSLVLGRDIKSLKTIRNARWIKINPADAQRLGLQDGEEVTVEAASGKLEGEAKFTERVPAGILETAFFYGRSPEFLSSGIIAVKIGRKTAE
ncbi:MAG: molybdopterin-dependent oxidoreductase [Candidatus Aminicenantales bacterium]